MNRSVTWNSLQDFEPLAEVLEAQTYLESDTPYGKVSGGHVRLKARMKVCHIKYYHHRPADEAWLQHNSAHLAYDHLKSGNAGKLRHFMADGLLIPHLYDFEKPAMMTARRAAVDERGEDMDVQACFLCVGRTSRLNFGHVGLIVVPSADRLGFFERVGNIVNLPKEWYHEGQETTVVLV
jgi:hypothetical protein